MRNSALSMVLLALGMPAYALPQLNDGDIVFHTSRSSQSLAVQRATGSKYSHMGVVFFTDGKPYVLEAVETVRYTPLDHWVARGVNSSVVVKRLRDEAKSLTPEGVKKLRVAAEQFLGRPYDLQFGWSDKKIYCSELVWKAYDQALGLQIGRLQQVRDFNLSDPAVRTKMKERYGNKVPLDEPVISPAAMFESPLLKTVVAR